MALMIKDSNGDLVPLANKSEVWQLYNTKQAAEEALANGEIAEGNIVATLQNSEEPFDASDVKKVARNVLNKTTVVSSISGSIWSAFKAEYYEDDTYWYVEYVIHNSSSSANTPTITTDLTGLVDPTWTYSSTTTSSICWDKRGGGTFTYSGDLTNSLLTVRIDTDYEHSSNALYVHMIIRGTK